MTTMKSKAVDRPESSTEPAKTEQELNPKTTRYEFLGPLGALGMTTVLPVLVLFFAVGCDSTGYPSKLLLHDHKAFFAKMMTPEYLGQLYDPMAFGVYVAFVALLAIFSLVLPGDVWPGSQLRDGTHLKYKMNGFASLHTTFFCGLYFIKDLGLKPLLFVHDHWVGLVVSSIIFSYLVSIFVYFKSFKKGALLALGGNTGNFIYDFMIGRELNPRIGEFDIKFFTELRPGMIGWAVINLSFAAKQYLDLHYITKSMVLVQVFQMWYIVDSLWNEEAVLTTMDITTDGFGFMLAFGLYTWVPFTYSLQARYLADFPTDISYYTAAGIVALNLIGYTIFRSANSQKNAFRINPVGPSVKHLKFIETKSGSRLITSGWWGMSRHINYLGDWLMALSWCLPCCFGSPIPYFYAFYFGILLLHRERRDDHKCRTKYGEDWDKYCSIVKYRIIPGVY
ncbi:lamin-B receptor-like protein [Phycomyces blakesleeanus]|uniref:Delta(14)-sterol reductase ERG24 n=2 Tax=Phycomyces blakesleeanus TaxID=4837 RepID=A0A167JQB3_PHYB8|nr:hypothetical protein PHYBLDRAFT_128480 [Phycomyces blakesleeanus NRRL 1555(-)]OAD66496.1 hypothetical protein PHYBLDRAFT_128480 [Phycomyces blakesleeanus NRRL 1555(-)]|eukprot:XP_018284536.1 hypothetical protein PHYBLDRAFT_128480 [Phycomyces blakesleeanus NRRL 1555(-)]